MKKTLLWALIIILVISTFSLNGFKVKANSLQVLFLYSDDDVHSYLNEYQHFQQSLVVNVDIEAKSWDQIEQRDLEDYDAIYLHRTLLQGKQTEDVSQSIEKYVENGGMIFVENELHSLFSEELLGASSFQKLEQYPVELSFPVVNDNVSGIQRVVESFHRDFLEYSNLEEFAGMDMGVSMTPSNAISIVDSNGQSLYTINQFGKGKVLFLSKMLANDYFIQSFDMLPKGQQVETFHFMFTTGSYLLKSELLSMLSKETYGYSVSKVLGPNGRPAMAWQNHFEVMEAMKEGGMEMWIDLLKDYNQIPSYSLVREAYDWGVWKEGIVFHQNIGSNQTPRYQGENAHSQYSSGEMIQVQGEPLAIGQYPANPSLGDIIEFPYRAAIDLGDLDQDGQLDIITGSASGEVFLVSEQSDSKRNFNKQEPLLLNTGKPVKVQGYSAPVLFDYNNDGLKDLIVGSEEGKLYYFEQDQDLSFHSPKVLINSTSSVIVPTIGTFDDDDVEDLVIGDADGNLLFYKGHEMNGSPSFSTKGILLEDDNGNINVGAFAAPKIVDYDGNGRSDLLVGMNDGFVARYEWNDDGLVNHGYLEGDTYNQYGDKRLWGGRNSIPALWDLDGDGKEDLLVGHLIFGYPIPIDSDSFPYKKELKASLKYASDHFIDIQPHLFFHSYKSNEQEQAEIELHKKAFEEYGLEWDRIGTNQHTWRINNLDYVQTFKNEIENGIWWNSGFKPSNHDGEPSMFNHYLWTMPFLLAEGEETKNFIVNNPAPNVPIFENVYPSYGELDLPISHFYHMEYPILSENGKQGGRQGLRYKAELLDNIRNQYDYNFVTEEQMHKSFLAAYKTESHISNNVFIKLWNGVQNQLRTKQHHNFTIKIDDAIDAEAEELMGIL